MTKSLLIIQNPVVDVPWERIVAECQKRIARGHDIQQKFSCRSCGQRLTIPDVNTLFTRGTCDKCGVLTDIKAQGCNYRALIPGNPANLSPQRVVTIREVDPAHVSEQAVRT